MKPLKITKKVLLFAISLTLFNCSDSKESIDSEQTSSSPADAQRITSIFGNGVNVQPSYYHGGNVKLDFDVLNDYNKVKTVRIEIDPRKMSVTSAKNRINEAQAAGFVVIATYHRADQLASNDPTHLYTAAYWWRDNYVGLGGDFYINLMNEWGGHTMSATTYKNAYNNAMNVIRTIPTYQTKPIIIDLAGYGQSATKAASIANELEQGESNFIFSAHIYNDAHNQGLSSSDTGPLNYNHLLALYNAHPNCIVGEFGFRTLNHETSVGNLINQIKTNFGWPVLGWCWTQDGLGMNMINSNLTGTNYPLVHISNTNPDPYSTTNYFNLIYNML
jgi:mannan endo-1,4-beta-mannosidase